MVALRNTKAPVFRGLFFMNQVWSVASPSNHLALPQIGDLVLAETELGKHLLGLFAEFGWARRHLARRARQRDWLRNQADVAVLAIGHVLGDAEVLNLGVIEHLVNRVDRPAGHACGVEVADPCLGGFLLSELADRSIERVAVFRPRRRGGVIRISDKFWRADRLRAALPDPPASGGDIDIAVGRLE